MKIVLIGHGMVGHKFLESLAETGITGVEVTVLCEEPRPAYDRVHLSEFFSGKVCRRAVSGGARLFRAHRLFAAAGHARRQH